MKIFVCGLWIIAILSACNTNKQAKNINSELVAIYNIEQGMRYLENGDMYNAKIQFKQAIQQAPKMPAAHYSYAYYFEQTGDMRLAALSYKAALNLDNTNGASLNSYGAFLCRQEKFAQAEKIFMQAVDDPRFLGTAFAYQNAGLCLLEEKNFEKAQVYFTAALAIDPQMSDSLIELAQIRYEQERYEDASQLYQRYIKIGDITPRTIWLGLTIAEKLGEQDAVASYIDELRNNFPQSPEAKILYEYGK